MRRRRAWSTLSGAASAPWLVLGLLSGAPAADADGNVEIKTRSDGTKLIFNKPSKRARRWSARLERPSAEIAYLIDRYAQQNDLSPRLVQAVIQVESGYNPWAKSRKGAMGLMQLMPETARLMRVSDPYDPDQNIRGGTGYLRRQLDRFSSLSLALAAYNAGPTVVTRYGGIPPFEETRDYVARVLRLFGRSPSLAAARDPAIRGPAIRGPAIGDPAIGDPAIRGGGPQPAVLREEVRENRPPPPAAAPPPEKPAPRGKKVYLSRGEGNRIVVTTARPKSR